MGWVPCRSDGSQVAYQRPKSSTNLFLIIFAGTLARLPWRVYLIFMKFAIVTLLLASGVSLSLRVEAGLRAPAIAAARISVAQWDASPSVVSVVFGVESASVVSEPFGV